MRIWDWDHDRTTVPQWQVGDEVIFRHRFFRVSCIDLEKGFVRFTDDLHDRNTEAASETSPVVNGD